MADRSQIRSLAQELLDAHDAAATVEQLTARVDGFDLDDAYAVLAEISAERQARGWVPAGRKIGFTNRTLWDLFGVDVPMWATVWDRTLVAASGDTARVSLDGLVAPRIEPEVAFGLRGPVPITDDPLAVLESVEWVAPSFEIVQCPFPGWSFALPDATAAFGLHAQLVVGTRVPVTDENRASLAASLGTFEATLSKDAEVADRGSGSNVLDSPALALVHLARVVAEHPDQPALVAGEVITTGTVTNAFPIVPGETWTSDYGDLGLTGLRVTFT